MVRGCLTPPVELANLRFLAGYRREWLISQAILAEMRSRVGDLVNVTITDGEQLLCDHSWPLVRPASMHLLWCHELNVDLTRRDSLNWPQEGGSMWLHQGRGGIVDAMHRVRPAPTRMSPTPGLDR